MLKKEVQVVFCIYLVFFKNSRMSCLHAPFLGVSGFHMRLFNISSPTSFSPTSRNSSSHLTSTLSSLSYIFVTLCYSTPPRCLLWRSVPGGHDKEHTDEDGVRVLLSAAVMPTRPRPPRQTIPALILSFQAPWHPPCRRCQMHPPGMVSIIAEQVEVARCKPASPANPMG